MLSIPLYRNGRAVKLEQRGAINYLRRNGDSAFVVHQKLKATYKEQCLSRPTVYRWYNEFKNGRSSVKLKGGPGAPVKVRTTEIVNTAATLVADDARITLRSVAHALQISLGTAHTILSKDLGYSRICARWIPRLLTDEMKAERVRIEFPAYKKVEVVPHPPYSPDLALNDFFCIRRSNAV